MEVKLPKEVAETIEYYMNPNTLTKYGVLDAIMTEARKETVQARIILIAKYGDGECWDVLMKAIVNGYEVEETLEDKVIALWKHADLEHRRIGTDVRMYWNGYLEGMSEALNTLNIKIEGVNA